MKNWLQLKVSILKIMKSWLCPDGSDFDYYWWGYSQMRDEIIDDFGIDYSLYSLKKGMKKLTEQGITEHTYMINLDSYAVCGSGYFLTELYK